ncbi:MAG: aminoacetone oxidase family FAD-binding enzyme [Lachnospiraceae bacterium]|nr:aminoacetone oxidase family FAD-binding enzyme [Lachnospiraceae bacterium]
MGNTVGIVGGGAAGMMAAVTAARRGGKVTLLEGNDRLGKKILSTGNGKCNLGNEKLGAEDYYTGRPDILEECLRRFGTGDTISFFQGIGLLVKSRNGYLYPACEQAAAVLDALRYEVRAAGVEVVTDFKVQSIERGRRTGRFRVQGTGGYCSFDRVILACGGKAAPRTGSDGSGYELAGQLGHGLAPTVPALVQLKCREESLKAVAGVRADAHIVVYFQGKPAAQERGELQLTEYGVSGIPMFQLSRTVNYILAGERTHSKTYQSAGQREKRPERGTVPGEDVEIEIDFLPDYTDEEYRALCAARKPLRRQRTVEEFFTGLLHKKLMLLFIKLAGLKPGEAAGEADERKLNRVYELCRHWRLHVTGSNSYDSAQVCAGGVLLDEVTGELESKLVPGLYFAGEILDVDGRCGGYNLQWAWSSGFVAGCGAAAL